MTAVFTGLRVVDFTTTIAGPHCSRLMADLGAEVIKIESPEGDMMRVRVPVRSGASAMFAQLNAGKKSIVLDLKRPQALAAARRLVERADVLVENYRPGVMKRLGLDYVSLSSANPRLVYCAISGYGQTGPSAGLAAYAPVIHAASGYDMAHLSYQQEGRTRPDNGGIWIADVLSGTYAFGAISAALHQRHLTGGGQLIDVSMLESMLSLTLLELQTAQFAFTPTARRFAEPLETADGHILVAVASELTFRGAAVATGNPGWVSDPRFALYEDRRTNWAAFLDELETWTRQRKTAECVASLAEHGVPSSAYRTVAEAMQDPQLAHRQALFTVTDEAGPLQALNPPFRMSDGVPRGAVRSPGLGEHTRAVLGELGYGEAEIASMSGKAEVSSDDEDETSRKLAAADRA